MGVFEREVYDVPDLEAKELLTVHQDIVIIATVMAENDHGLLSKVLASVGQSIDSADIHTMDKTEKRRIYTEKPCLVMCFGIHPRQLFLQIDNTPYGLRLVNNITYIFSRSLADLPSRAEERRALWHALKRYYNIS